jgi:hypothetical protein
LEAVPGIVRARQGEPGLKGTRPFIFRRNAAIRI